MSQVSDQRGWKDRDLTEHKNWGKPEKRMIWGVNRRVWFQTLEFKMPRENAGGCACKQLELLAWAV